MILSQQQEQKQDPPNIAEIVEAAVRAISTEIQELYCLDSIPWIIGDRKSVV